MRLWGYYAAHTFINCIKKIFKSKTAIVILCCFGIGLIFGVGGGAVASAIADKQAQEVSSETEVSTQDDEAIDEEEEEMTPEDIALVKKIISAIVVLVIFAGILWGIYGGSKSGSNIFLMPDVNFLFTAPIKAQSVLMFRLSFQMVATLIGSIYLLAQIPNLVINLGLSGYAVFAIFMAWLFAIIIMKLMSVLSYTVTSTHEKLKKYIVPFIMTVAFIVLGATALVFISCEKDFERTLDLTYSAPWSDYVPVFGWFKAMVMHAVDGNIGTSLLYVILNTLVLIILFVLIWRIKADFYEDAMSGAAERETTISAAKEGRQVQVNEKLAKRREKRLQRREARDKGLKGWGASVFLQKSIYNRRRFSKFGFMTNTMITYTGITAVVSFVLFKTQTYEFAIVGFIILATLFFRNFGNPIAVETGRNWLFLVPESPYKKVFFAMMGGTVDCAIDLIPTMLIGGILLKANPFSILLWYVCLIVMDTMFSCFGLLLEALLPVSAMDTIKSVIQMMLRLMMLLIVVAVIVAGYVLQGVELGLFLNLLFDIGVSVVCFIAYPTMLHKGIG